MRIAPSVMVFLIVIAPVAAWSQSSGRNLNSEILQAAASGDTSSVKILLDEGAGLEAANDAGATPLMWAVINGHAETVKLLLDRGANVNAKTQSGATALHGAASQRKAEVVRLLLGRGADLNATDSEGKSPLSEAVSGGHWDVVSLLKGPVKNAVRASAPPHPAPGYPGVVVSIDRPEQCLRVRRGPGTNHEKIGCEPLGQQIRLSGLIHQGWVELVDPVKGWVTTSQVRAEGLVMPKPVPTKKARKAKSEDDDEELSADDDSERDDHIERIGRGADEEIESLREEAEAAESAPPIQGQRGMSIGIGSGRFRK